jgi:DNA polymerase III delta prime subunit
MKLWTEFYRPKTVDEYVFRDETQKQQILSWIKQGSIPHLLLTGSAGTGKTTLAKVLFNELNVNSYDILEINASRNNGVDYLREVISNFASMIPFGPFKVILLDEADFLSFASQSVLRGIMEEYHETARFVLTANYPHKIIPAIHSRCQSYHIQKVDHTEFTARAATILVSENVEFELNTLDSFVKATYPDLRKCINLMQQSVVNSVLTLPQDAGTVDDYMVKATVLFKEGKVRQARELLCGKIQPDEIVELYRWMYENIELFGETQEQVESSILIIKQGLVDHAVCADAEINLSAVMIKLARLKD